MELDITTLHGRLKKSGQFYRGSFYCWCRYNISFKTCLHNRWAQKTETIHLYKLIFPVSYGLTLRTNFQPNRILVCPEPAQASLTWFPSWEKIGNTGGKTGIATGTNPEIPALWSVGLLVGKNLWNASLEKKRMDASLWSSDVAKRAGQG